MMATRKFEELAKEQGIWLESSRDWRRAGVADGSIVRRTGARNAILFYLADMAPGEVSICSEDLIAAPEGGQCVEE